MIATCELQHTTFNSGKDPCRSNLKTDSLLSAKDERNLARLVQAGDRDARERMIQANLGLVIHLARGFQGRGVDLPDLIAEGNVGLIRAVEVFDPDRNVRFSTYAVHWIRQSLHKAVQRQGKPIRIPGYMLTLLTKCRREESLFQEQFGRLPDDGELADRLGLSSRQWSALQQARHVYHMPGHSNINESEPIVPSTSIPAEVSDQNERLTGILNRMNNLAEREAIVLRGRFGLDEEGPQSLKDIGRRLGVTPERIRQIERKALSRLREFMQAS